MNEENRGFETIVREIFQMLKAEASEAFYFLKIASYAMIFLIPAVLILVIFISFIETPTSLQEELFRACLSVLNMIIEVVTGIIGIK